MCVTGGGHTQLAGDVYHWWWTHTASRGCVYKCRSQMVLIFCDRCSLCTTWPKGFCNGRQSQGRRGHGGPDVSSARQWHQGWHGGTNACGNTLAHIRTFSPNLVRHHTMTFMYGEVNESHLLCQARCYCHKIYIVL